MKKITHFMNAFFQINVLVEKLHSMNKNVAPNKLVLEGKSQKFHNHLRSKWCFIGTEKVSSMNLKLKIQNII